VYDIISQKMKSTLRLSDASSIKYSDKTIHTYRIVLIALSCATLLIVIVYLLYRKCKKKTRFKSGNTKHNDPMREVWSSPDLYNTNNIII
jgi:hypothetical protein